MISRYLKALGKDIAEIGTTFAQGDWKTRLSYLVFGIGPLLRGQIVKGFAYLACELLFIWYMISFGWQYLSKFSTLGTVETHKERRVTVYGDNSFLILLFSLLTIILILLIIVVWRMNIRENRNEELALKAGKALPENRKILGSLLDSNFDKTLLALPVLGIFVFTVLPILFMICVAFTNYDKTHQAPTNLFTWVGMENFRQLFSFGSTGFGTTFVRVLIWTLVWAFFATFLDYFLGMAVAILINKKGIRFKKLWRTILVITIAVPQFVSLLYVYKMFANDGLVNGYLLKWGWITSPIPFWTNPMLARITIIVVNIWIGIPYMMLIATGLLMNIPEELYESARIDGASPFQMFRSITLPYMLFVTGPFLLTQFTANLNNFNVIYLLTKGQPQSMKMAENAGHTDLLVTWLYKMTVTNTNYKMAAVIGIMVFLVVAITSLVVYNMLPSVRDEGGFQMMEKQTGSMKRKQRISNTVTYIVLVVISIIWLFPFFGLIMQSFRSYDPKVEYGGMVDYIIPKHFSLDNYRFLFSGETNYLRWYGNTLIIAVCVSVFQTIIILCVSYALSRMRFKGRQALMRFWLVLGMFPGFLTLICLYFLLKQFGLTQAGAVPGLILVSVASSGMGYYVCKGYFDTLPIALDEAARIDGASRAKIFLIVTAPLSKPIIIYTALVAFMGPWCDFVMASYIAFGHDSSYNVAVALQRWVWTNDYQGYFTRFCAGGILVAIPVTLLFMFLQKYYVEGVTGGAVKG